MNDFMVQLQEYKPKIVTAAMLITSRRLTPEMELLMQTYSILAPYFPANLDDYAPWVTAHGLTAPYGECQCGCGQDTAISRFNKPDFGHVKGKPVRFVRWHRADRYPLADNPNPSGLCMCGCGRATKIAAKTDLRAGQVKGHPLRFIPEHAGLYKTKPTMEEAFWEHAIPGDPDTCWEWLGTTDNKGYGRFMHRNKVYSAHRVSYELHHGFIPAGYLVCHECDNPPCWNPKHLFAGTTKDNIVDMMAKGRGKGQFQRAEDRGESRNEST